LLPARSNVVLSNRIHSRNIDHELNQYLNEPGFIPSLNLSKYSTPEIEAWLRSMIGKSYPRDYAPQEMQALRVIRGRWNNWLKRGRKPRQDASAVELVDAPELIRELLLEIAEDFDQPLLSDDWPIKGFTKDELLEAEDDLGKLSVDDLDLVVAAIVHASRDFPSAVEAALTFVPNGGRPS
jgi:hypothetical protein